jgi:hypothetical protein
VVTIDKALMAAAGGAIQPVVERVEATQQLHELALYDAQLAVLHLAGELLHHGYCRNNPKSADLLRKWAPERVWEFLDVAQAMRTEADLKGWKQAEYTPSSAAPPTSQAALPTLMAVPLRIAAAIPSRRATTPFRERDWFRKRTSAAFVAKANQRLEKDKRGWSRFLTEGAFGGEVSGDAGTSAADTQLSEEAGGAPTEGGSDTDSSNESEPEPSGDRDPLGPEPNFRRHPNAWRLWAARAERRRAAGKASGPAAATASFLGKEREDRWAPAKPLQPKP